MKPLVSLVAVSLVFASAAASACGVTGVARNRAGEPLRHAAVVRLVDLDSMRESYATADARSGFAIDADGASGQRMRLDLLSAPTVVMGSRIPTRSIIGQSAVFACSGSTQQDVRVQID
ncbi:MAG TPA: hypothetical protein VF132_11015 [Rudaea sp.]